MKKSRLETYVQVSKKMPEMPPTKGLEYLVEHMLSVGPGMPSYSGLIPVDFKEIAAYDKLDMLSMTDRKAIRDLSRAYVGQLNISSAWTCLAPWVKGVDDVELHHMKQELKEKTPEPAKANSLSRKRKKR